MNSGNKAAYEEKLALAKLLGEHVGSQDDPLMLSFHLLANLGKCLLCIEELGKDHPDSQGPRQEAK